MDYILNVFDAGPGSDSDRTLSSLRIVDITNKKFEFGTSKAGLVAIPQLVVHRNHDDK
jgi:hypothetical protein